jgi:hypothetical protein
MIFSRSGAAAAWPSTAPAGEVLPCVLTLALAMESG